MCADPDTKIWVRWFVVPDCTPFLPFLSAFSEVVWDPTDYEWGQFTGVGPVGFVPRVWDPGLPPVPPQPFAGEPDWFRFGIPANKLPP